MRVLVTGSEGYIGTALAPMLSIAGHEVTRLDTLMFEGCEAEPYDNAGLWRADFRDLSAADLASFDAVIHLAGLANDPMGDVDPEHTYALNHWAAVELAGKAQRAGVGRFVLSSTCSVYGARGEEFLTESDTPAPITPYARSKWLAEQGISALAGDDFCAISLRLGTVYGWSPMTRFDLVVNHFVAGARLNGRITLTSDGSAWRPLVHVEDCARAFRACLDAPSETVAGEVFNIGRTADNIRILDLAREVAVRLPNCLVEHRTDAPADRRSYRVDFGKAVIGLAGFVPVWNVADGITELAQHVAAMPEDRLRALLPSRIAHLLAALRAEPAAAQFGKRA